MAAATRHVKRGATVTETFAAVTPRMVKSDQRQARDAQPEAQLISVGALVGERSPSAAEAATSLGPLSPRLEAVPSQSSAGNSPLTLGHVGTAARGEPALSERPKVGSRMGPAAQSSAAGVSFVSAIKTRQKEVGFQILAGAAQKLHRSLEAGAVGGVLAFADPAPTACYEIYAAWKEGDAELANLKQERISKASMRVGSQIGIPGMKYALDLNGYYGGPPRLPLLPLTADLKREVEQLMADIRN